MDGDFDGPDVGSLVGRAVGVLLGDFEGDAVGSLVGCGFVEEFRS